MSTSGKCCTKEKRANKQQKGQKHLTAIVPFDKSAKTQLVLANQTHSCDGKKLASLPAELPYKSKILLREGSSSHTVYKRNKSSSYEHLPSFLGLLGGCIIATLMNPTVLNWVRRVSKHHLTIVQAISIGDIIDTAVLLPVPLLWGMLLYTLFADKELCLNGTLKMHKLQLSLRLNI